MFSRRWPFLKWWASSFMCSGSNFQCFILVVCLPCVCSLFAADCASRVRLQWVTNTLPKQCAQDSLAESPFGTERRLLLQFQWAYGWQTSHSSSMVSTSYGSPTDHGKLLYTWWYHRYNTGEFSISTVLDLFGLPEYRSSALRGRLRHSPASWTTLRAPSPLLLVHSFPTLCYFSSCLLGCAPCAAVRLLWDTRSGSRCGYGSSCWSWCS